MPQNQATVATGSANDELPLPPTRNGDDNRKKVGRFHKLHYLLNILSCGYKSNAQLFGNLHRVEDSVHVMIRHDKEKAQKKGQQTKGYTPRRPLPSNLASLRHANATGAEQQGIVIKATEDDEESEADKRLNAALNADGVAGSSLSQ